jgi:hypothetical protein
LISLRDEGGLDTLKRDYGGAEGIVNALETDLKTGIKSSEVQVTENTNLSIVLCGRCDL